MQTHRCKASLAAKVSIRKYEDSDQTNRQYGLVLPYEIECGWQVGSMEMDSEWGEQYMNYGLSHVQYCPYCGEKLDPVS